MNERGRSGGAVLLGRFEFSSGKKDDFGALKEEEFGVVGLGNGFAGTFPPFSKFQ